MTAGKIARLNTDVRFLSHRFHPSVFNDLGLPTALQTEFGQRENMPATFSSQHMPENWPRPTALAIYRIAQKPCEMFPSTRVKLMSRWCYRVLMPGC